MRVRHVLAVTVAAGWCLAGCNGGPFHQRDAGDAAKFAETYAKTLKHPGEDLRGSGCGQVPEGSQHYQCDAIFGPSQRTICFNLTANGDSYKLSGQRPGKHFDPMDLSGDCRKR
jgi:hypothetical protein